MKSYAVIGLGKFGFQLATKLSNHGADVIAIDCNEDAVEQIADEVTRAVTVDARNEEVLRSLGVQDCDCAIVCIGEDMAASILVTMHLKNIGVAHIICKAVDSTHRDVLLQLGAERVIIPEWVVAERIATSLAAPNVLQMIDLSDEYGVVEQMTPLSWVGKSIRELNIRAKYDVNLIAVKHHSELIVSPNADYVFPENSISVLLGAYTRLDVIENLR